MSYRPETVMVGTNSVRACKFTLPSRVPPLTSLYMYISGSSNLTLCRCWIEPDLHAGNKNNNFFKPEVIKKVVQEAKPLGLQSVKLTGGEPLVHPQFQEIDDLKRKWTDSNKIKRLRKLIPSHILRIYKNYIHLKECFGACNAQISQATKHHINSYYFCSEVNSIELFPKQRKINNFSIMEAFQ